MRVPFSYKAYGVTRCRSEIRMRISDIVNLFLQQIIDDLPAVLAVGTIGDVDPIGASLAMLPDELVELAVRLDPFEPPLALL